MTTADDTDTAVAIFARAAEHQRQGRIAEALTLYNAILRIAPDNAAVHCNRGIALQIMGRLNEALQSYEEAIRCRPGFADAYFNKAMALGVLRHPKEALDNYDLALQYKPDHLGAWPFKGNTLLDLGRSDEALACLRNVIASRSGNRDSASTASKLESVGKEAENRPAI